MEAVREAYDAAVISAERRLTRAPALKKEVSPEDKQHILVVVATIAPPTAAAISC